MDSNELLRRFKLAGWQTAPEVQAFIADAGGLGRDDIERFLGVITTRGLGGTAADQRNRCLVFTRLAEPVVDKALFLPYVRAMKGGDLQVANAVAPLLARVDNVDGHAELAAVLRAADPAIRKVAGSVLRQIGGTTVFQAVGALCGQKDFGGRVEAMETVVTIGRHHAI